MPFPQLPIYAALSVFNVSFSLKTLFEKKLSKTQALTSMSNSKLATNI